MNEDDLPPLNPDDVFAFHDEAIERDDVSNEFDLDHTFGLEPEVPDHFHSERLLESERLYSDGFDIFDTDEGPWEGDTEYYLLVDEAAQLIERGRNAEAAPMLQQALTFRPNDANLRDRLIRLYTELADFDSVLKLADAAIILHPDDYLWQYWRSNALRRLGDYRGALAAAEAAVRLAPGERYTYYHLAFIQQLCGEEARAEQTVRHLLELAPEWDGTVYMVAWVAMEQGRWQEAEVYFCKELELTPDLAIAQRYLGYVYERLGRRREAIEMYYRSSLNGPASDWLRDRLEETTQAQGFDSVEEYGRRREDPAVWTYISRRSTLLQRAREALDNTNAAEAIRILNSALPAYSRDVLFLDQLAAAYWAAKALPPALHYAAMAVVEAPEDWRGHLRRGQILVAMSEEATGEASRRLRKDGIAAALHAVALAGDNRWVLSRLVSLQHSCNMLQEAEQTAQRLLLLAPDWADSYYYVAIVYHARGLLRLAETYYRQALKQNPNDAGVYSDLARALWELNRRPEAIQCFRRTVELEPGNPYYDHNYRLSQARMKGNLAVNFYVLSRIRDYRLFTES